MSNSSEIGWFVTDEELQKGEFNLAEVSPCVAPYAAYLDEELVGQTNAKRTFLGILEELKAGLNIREGNLPIAVVLLAGPSGVGKTTLARCLQRLMNDLCSVDETVLQINCGDYNGESASSLNNLRGVPPGHIGSVNEPELHPFNVRRGRVVLFDEIEKGGRPFHDFLLPLFADGEITVFHDKNEYSTVTRPGARRGPVTANGAIIKSEHDPDPETENGTSVTSVFRENVIVITSNLGIDQMATGSNGKIGLKEQAEEVDHMDFVMTAFAQQFRGEMTRRISHRVAFEYFTRDEVLELMRIERTRYMTQCIQQSGMMVSFLEDGIERICTHLFESREVHKQGAGAVKNFFKEKILPVLARTINQKAIEPSKCLVIDYVDGEVIGRVPDAPDGDQDVAQVHDLVRLTKDASAKA